MLGDESFTLGSDGLTWARPWDWLQGVTWLEASNRCAALDPAGTWRLPKRRELHRLVNYGVSDGIMMDAEVATLLLAELPLSLWTSVLYGTAEEGSAWIVDFDNGVVRRASVLSHSGMGVLCVSE